MAPLGRWLEQSVPALLSLSLIYQLAYAGSQSDQSCKSTPGSPSWPSDVAWQQLNTSISGHLLKPLPPAAVCDPTIPGFNNASCTLVYSQYTQSIFHANDPVSVDYPNWENDSCLPFPLGSCKLSQFPVFVVNASEPAHVKAGVDFAREHNVRLIVKGTGHDFLGRSTASYSLSIWTHHLRGLEFHPSFRPQGCSTHYSSAITVAAGMQMRDLSPFAAAYNVTPVGGADPDVGVGGYLTGGGHSPISAQYGMASDQALEFEIVTPSGDILTVNECSHTDLFWATRGGGGSTFGVLLSATVKTVPLPAVASQVFGFNSSVQSYDDFWAAVAYLHTQIPSLSEQGLMGYYFITTVNDTVFGEKMMYYCLFYLLNKQPQDVEAVLNPLLSSLRNSSFSNGITSDALPATVADYYSWFQQYSPGQPVGFNTRCGNRLLDRTALTQDVSTLGSKLKTAFSGFLLEGNFVGGNGTMNANPPGGTGALNPAWRKAYVELVTAVSWPYLNQTAGDDQANLLTNTYMAALRELAPDTGTYTNEADIDEPNLPQAFWGANYPRLLAIKQKYDRHGVFWCQPCVGADEWKLVNGTLCKA